MHTREVEFIILYNFASEQAKGYLTLVSI